MRTLTAAEARFFWGLIPADCKPSLIKLQRSGRLPQLRDALIAQAEADLKLLGKYGPMEVCIALEMAAEHYLEEHP